MKDATYFVMGLAVVTAAIVLNLFIAPSKPTKQPVKKEVKEEKKKGIDGEFVNAFTGYARLRLSEHGSIQLPQQDETRSFDIVVNEGRYTLLPGTNEHQFVIQAVFTDREEVYRFHWDKWQDGLEDVIFGDGAMFIRPRAYAIDQFELRKYRR